MRNFDVNLADMTDDEVRDWLEQFGDLGEFADHYTGYWCTLSIPPIDMLDMPEGTVQVLAYSEGASDRSMALRATAADWFDILQSNGHWADRAEPSARGFVEDLTRLTHMVLGDDVEVSVRRKEGVNNDHNG